jgi:hypothetical protein
MDDELTGFGLRVSPAKRVFYLQMRVGRRALKRKIGDYGPVTADQAGKSALQLKAQLLDGKDPYEERHQGSKAQALRRFRERIRVSSLAIRNRRTESLSLRIGG